jgi:hypothetical protein
VKKDMMKEYRIQYSEYRRKRLLMIRRIQNPESRIQEKNNASSVTV